MRNPPGRRQASNNGGYVLLAEIVKRTSGRSLGAGGSRTLRIVGERPTPAVLERVASYTPAASVGAITFVRDRQGRPTACTVHAYAARGIRFERRPRNDTR